MRHVALLVETSRGYGRQVALGVARYSSLHGPWSFMLTPGDFDQILPEMKYWGGDGIIARLENEQVERAVLAADLPTIALDMNERQLDPENPLSRFTNLAVDSEAAAELVADHLIGHGLKNFAFVGVKGKIWSKRREVAFAKRVAADGHQIAIYEPTDDESKVPWELERGRLADWLSTLPRPVGVMACNDVRGRQVLDACRMASLVVPKDVAVVGVDNDELFCELAYPTLSSVALNGVMAGYRAAERLDAMMRRKAKPTTRGTTLAVEALRVIERESSNLYNIDDVVVVAALQFITQARGKRLAVDDVVKVSNLSQRELDRRFREAVGHSISSEIQRTQLDLAKRLLEETDHPVPQIAKMAGYSSASYMIQVFRRRLDTTPAKYRASFRLLTVEASQDKP
jgi:LacI family transcriptional regulator